MNRVGGSFKSWINALAPVECNLSLQITAPGHRCEQRLNQFTEAKAYQIVLDVPKFRSISVAELCKYWLDRILNFLEMDIYNFQQQTLSAYEDTLCQFLDQSD